MSRVVGTVTAALLGVALAEYGAPWWSALIVGGLIAIVEIVVKGIVR